MTGNPGQDGIVDDGDGVLIDLKGVPRSSKTELQRSDEGLYRIRIAAPPVQGAANADIMKFLAKTLGVPKRNVSLVHGQKGKYKRFRVDGVKAKDARRIFAEVAK